MWDVQVRSYAGGGGSYIELRIGGDRCVSFDSPQELHEFVQQLPAIGAQLKAASRDAFPARGAPSEAPTDGSRPRAD